MSNPMSPSLRNRLRGCAVVIICVAATVAVSPARAGLGSLVKKAKDKAAQAVAPKTAPAAPADAGKVEFDDVVLELTNDRIEHILGAFQAASAAAAGRPELVAKLNQTNEERQGVLDKSGEAIRVARNKRSDVEVCYHDGYTEAHNRRMMEYQQKALTDPAIRAKFARAAQENNAAGASDSAALARITQAFHEVAGPTHEDSVAVQQKCGSIPPRLPAEDKVDALDKQIASFEERIRQIDDKVAEAQAKQGGLDREQWGMAIERIRMFLSAKTSKSASKSAIRGFSPVELEALEKHFEQLRAALG